MSTPEIKAAEAELKAAQDRVSAAEAALSTEKAGVEKAREKLHAARLAHDKTLPRAVVKVTGRYSRNVEINKSGSWHPYPASSSNFGSWRELIINSAKGGA